MQWPQAVAQVATCPCHIHIEAGNCMTITCSVIADCIDVETGGDLIIEGSGKLTLIGPGPSTVDGNVLLVPDNFKMIFPVLEFTGNDHTVTGSGKIKGFSNLAEIAIDNVTFTSDVKITGHLQITGAGTFANEGSVTADNPNGILEIAMTGTIDDSVGASWAVEAVGAFLRFLEEPACLRGDFIVTTGTLRAGEDIGGDDIDVVTTGSLTHTGGKIIAGVDDSFTFNAKSCP